MGTTAEKKAKPFEGLTRQPVCELCVADAEKQEEETKREPPPRIERAKGRRREVARIFEVDKDTVFSWLAQAAKHSEAVVGYMVHNLHLSQVQMDELYALLSGMREDGERRSCWVWVAMDPLSKLWLTITVGDRSLMTLVPAVQCRCGTATGAQSGECADTRSGADVLDRPVGGIRESVAGAFRSLGREGE